MMATRTFARRLDRLARTDAARRDATRLHVAWHALTADGWTCRHFDGTRHPLGAPCSAIGGPTAVYAFDPDAMP